MTATRNRVVATRRSQLALAQARNFCTQLQTASPGLQIQELHVVTTGDRVLDRPLAEFGGKGVFVKEIEQALIDHQAHFAVHSVKDIPAQLAPGLRIACVPQRASACDVLVSRSGARFSELPAGARVGTSSLRRTVLLKRARPELVFVPLRGNVDTRLRKVRDGLVDAAVLAHAGLLRLQLDKEITELLPITLCIPAVGQGALGIECCEGDDETAELLAALHHRETALAVAAERGVMIAVEGNCRTPVAAYATKTERGQLRLFAMLAEPDGSRLRIAEEIAAWPRHEPEAEQFGLQVGEALRFGR